MASFRDLDKKANDVLRVGFVHDKIWQVAINHSGENPKFSVFGMMPTSKVMDASPSVNYRAGGLNISAKAGSSGASHIDTKYTFPKFDNPMGCSLFEGLLSVTVGSKVERKMAKGTASDCTEFSAEVKNDNCHSAMNFNPHTMTWGMLKAYTIPRSFCPCGTATMGYNVTGNGMDMNEFKYTVGAAYSRDNDKPWTFSIKAVPTDSLAIGKLTAAIFAATEKGHAFAAEANHTLASQTTQVTFGGLVNLSEKKDTSLKIKVMPDAQVAAVLTHKFSNELTGNFGCQFDSCGSSDSVKYGMKMTVKC